MPDKDKKQADIVAVAKAAKVSISTVSRSFNHPELVNAATRKKIDGAVRKLGYIRNRAAQTMHGIRSGTIGLVVPTIDHAIFAEVIQAFSDAVETQGFTILVGSHGYDLEREYAILRKFLEHRVDGVALIGLEHSQGTFDLIEQQGVPALTLWNFDDHSRLSCVGSDNHMAGRIAAQHLIDLGHTRVGLVFPPTDGNDRARDRMEGAQTALEAAGCLADAPWRVEANYSISDAKEAVRRTLPQAPLPTAFLCGNDVLAVGTQYALTETGIRVPDDVSLIGIGDFKGSRDMAPALSTVRIPAQRIGQIAGERLSDMIVHSKDDLVRIRVDVELAARATTQTGS